MRKIMFIILVFNSLLQAQQGNILGFKIERKIEGGNYEFLVEVGPNLRSFDDTNLSPNTTYYYRIYAYNSEGNSEYSNEVKVVTLSSFTQITIPPLAPNSLTGIVVSSSQIVLSWVDNSTNETGFKIERKMLGGSYIVVSTVGANITSYTDKNLSCGTTYYYRICAYNNGGDSGYSNEVVLVTLTPKIQEIFPSITHIPIEEINVPNNIEIRSEIKSEVEIQTVKILFKDKYNNWLEKEMNYLGENIWRGVILYEDLPSDEVAYRIVVVDNKGSSNSSEIYNIRIVLQKEEVMGIYGGNIVLADGNPDDGETSVEVPYGVFKESGYMSVSIKNATMLPSHQNRDKVSCSLPVMSYEIKTSQEVGYLPNNIILKLLYLDRDNDGKEDISNIDERNMKIWWLDGVEWRYIGGEVDIVNNIITAKTNRLGVYGIFPTVSIDGNTFRPKEKMMMLNSDLLSSSSKMKGIIFNGIHNAGVKVKIYDIKGKKVKELDATDVWNGKDENGNYIPTGVYIYQYEYDGKKYQGTIVVGR